MPTPKPRYSVTYREISTCLDEDFGYEESYGYDIEPYELSGNDFDALDATVVAMHNHAMQSHVSVCDNNTIGRITRFVYQIDGWLPCEDGNELHVDENGKATDEPIEVFDALNIDRNFSLAWEKASDSWRKRYLNDDAAYATVNDILRQQIAAGA